MDAGHDDHHPKQKPKLLDQVREAIRAKHYSHRTDSAPHP
jgi:hypothetical protein